MVAAFTSTKAATTRSHRSRHTPALLPAYEISVESGAGLVDTTRKFCAAPYGALLELGSVWRPGASHRAAAKDERESERSCA